GMIATHKAGLTLGDDGRTAALARFLLGLLVVVGRTHGPPGIDLGGLVRHPARGCAVGVVDLLVDLLLRVGAHRTALLGRRRQRCQREQHGRNDSQGSHGGLSVDDGSGYGLATTWCGAAERRQYAPKAGPGDALDPPSPREKMAEIRPGAAT